MTVLIVADDAPVRDLVCAQLRDQGVDVTVAASLREAGDALGRERFDVVIVDLSLPGEGGYSVLARIEASPSSPHVITLSSSTADLDRKAAFERGATDFVIKPFYARELTARVLAVGRTRDPTADSLLRVGALQVDLSARVVSADGRPLDLTPKEFDLLAFLAARPGYVFSREQLLKAVWQSSSAWQQAATVTEHVSRLRAKIEADPQHPRILRTVRGSGYRLDHPEEPDRAAESAAGPHTLRCGVLIHVDERVVFADRAVGAIVGYDDPADLLGKHVLDLVAPSSRAAAAARLDAAATGEDHRSELLDLQRADGTVVPVGISSVLTEWEGSPARRATFIPQTDAPARLRQLVTGVVSELTEAVLITDLHFHIRSWNAAAERLYGWTEREVLGRHVLDVMQWVGDQDENDELAAAWEDLERKGRWYGRSRRSTREGSVVEVLATITLLRDHLGAPVGIVSVNRLAPTGGRSIASDGDAGDAGDEAMIRRGLDNCEFEVHYQPMVELRSRTMVGVEALVRWAHPERGLLGPPEFLPAAERSGVIIELGALVLEEACGQVARWRGEGSDIHLSVNLSTRQLADSGLVDGLVGILDRSGLDPTSLWLEVTETALMEELEAAVESLHRLVALGIRIAIDDFGTGWASLTYLQRFPVHVLKIDGSFVAGAGQNVTDSAIVRSIVSLAAELDLIVVAEGIETAAQHEALQRVGCPYGQGFLHGRALPPAEVPTQSANRLAVAGARSGAISPVGAPRVATEAGHVRYASPGRRGGTATDLLVTPTLPAVRLGERAELDAAAGMLRALLRVRSAGAAVDVLQQTIRGMGGTLVDAADAGEDALPIDVALGEGPPTLVEVERFTVTRMQLERSLPRLVEDARQAVDLLRQTERLEDETVRDALTGLSNRRALDRVVPRATSGSVVMIDLDHFSTVNDDGGHAGGDVALALFGRILADHVRADDTVCRMGGDEFAIIYANTDAEGAVALVDRIRSAWGAEAPEGVTFSAGVANVSDRGGTAAILAADHALYRAKALGRNRTEVTADSVESASEAGG